MVERSHYSKVWAMTPSDAREYNTKLVKQKIRYNTLDKEPCFLCHTFNDVCVVLPNPYDKERIVFACRQHKKLVPREIFDTPEKKPKKITYRRRAK